MLMFSGGAKVTQGHRSTGQDKGHDGIASVTPSLPARVMEGSLGAELIGLGCPDDGVGARGPPRWRYSAGP